MAARLCCALHGQTEPLAVLRMRQGAPLGTLQHLAVRPTAFDFDSSMLMVPLGLWGLGGLPGPGLVRLIPP